MTYSNRSFADKRETGLARSAGGAHPHTGDASASWLQAELDMLLTLLAEREAEVRLLRSELYEARTAERHRIARELHDGLAQLTSAAHLQLQALTGVYRPRSLQSRVALERAMDLTRRASVEVRRVMAGSPPEALEGRTLVEAIQPEVTALHNDGWDITAKFVDLGPLPADVELALFRLVQEALHNIRKHAGRCRVQVTMARDDVTMWLEIADEGCGFDGAAIRAGCAGIAGMRERVALLEGTMTIQSQPGAGTYIRITLPITWQQSKVKHHDMPACAGCADAGACTHC